MVAGSPPSSISSSDRSLSLTSLCYSDDERESCVSDISVVSHSSSDNVVLPQLKKSVSWSDPLVEIRYVEQEGRCQSTAEFRRDVGNVLQRRQRSEEIASMREFFFDGSDSGESTVSKARKLSEPTLYDDLDIESRSSSYSSSSAVKYTYDLSKATFTFKAIQYDPTIPVFVSQMSNPPNKIDNPSSSTESQESSSSNPECYGDISLSMQRNMMSRMPPFLRSYASYGFLVSSNQGH